MNELDYKKLWQQLKNFVTLQIDYSKLTVAEKLSILFSRVLLVAVVLLIGVLLLMQLMGAIVAALTVSLGSASMAHLIAGGILILLLLVIFAFRTQLIVNPVTRFVTKLFFNPEDK